jgi:hypothetical protein
MIYKDTNTMSRFAKFMSKNASSLGMAAAGTGAGVGMGISANNPELVAQSIVGGIGDLVIDEATEQLTKKAATKAAKEVGEEVGEQVAKKVAQKVAQKVATKAAAKAGQQLGMSILKKLGSTAFLATGGPIGWAVQAVLAIIQITSAIMDMLWNPLEAKFNKDLSELKETIDSSIRKQYLKDGYEYPLEIKPNIIPTTDEDYEEFQKLIKQYYDDNGLISEEEAETEEETFRILGLLKRQNQVTINPLFTNINLLSGTQQNIAILIAVAAAKKKGYGNLDKAIDIDFKNYKFSPYKQYIQWFKLNWQLFVSIFVIILLSIFISLSYLFFI